MEASQSSSSTSEDRRSTVVPAEPVELQVDAQSGGGGLRGLLSSWMLRSTPAAGASSAGSLLDRVIAARGAARPTPMDEVTFGHLERPDQLSGAVEAAARLSEAIDQGRRIAIHGDYEIEQ